MTQTIFTDPNYHGEELNADLICVHNNGEKTFEEIQSLLKEQYPQSKNTVITVDTIPDCPHDIIFYAEIKTINPCPYKVTGDGFYFKTKKVRIAIQLNEAEIDVGHLLLDILHFYQERQLQENKPKFY